MDEASGERVPVGDVDRVQAGRRLMAQFHDDGQPEPDWAESKQTLMCAQVTNRCSQ